MAQRQLRIASRVLMACLAFAALQACREDDAPIGVTLVYKCEGLPIVVRQFQPDGLRDMSPGALTCGPKGGAEMTYMPGDGAGKLPRYVDVEWWIHPHKENRFHKRVDLGAVVTSELIKVVQANRQTTQLELILTFKEDQLEVSARADKWR